MSPELVPLEMLSSSPDCPASFLAFPPMSVVISKVGERFLSLSKVPHLDSFLLLR